MLTPGICLPLERDFYLGRDKGFFTDVFQAFQMVSVTQCLGNTE